MAKSDTRTWQDDARDALAQLEAVQREAANWKTHLEAVLADPAEGHALMADRTQSIVSAAVSDAAHKTCRVRSHLYPRVIMDTRLAG